MRLEPEFIYDRLCGIIERVVAMNQDNQDVLSRIEHNVKGVVDHAELKIGAESFLDLIADYETQITLQDFRLLMQIASQLESTRYSWNDFAPEDVR